jgi:hypothetical protein
LRRLHFTLLLQLTRVFLKLFNLFHDFIIFLGIEVITRFYKYMKTRLACLRPTRFSTRQFIIDMGHVHVCVREVARISPMKEQPHELCLVWHITPQDSHRSTQGPCEWLVKPCAH